MTTRKLNPDRDVLTLARLLENLAYRMPAIDEAIRVRFRDLDAWKARTLGDGLPTGTTEDTTVERYCMQRLELVDELEMIAGRVAGIRAHVDALTKMGERVLRGIDWRPVQQLCSSAGHTGAELPWLKGGSLDGNGWADPECHDIAEDGGLCLRCARRKDRWLAHKAEAVEVAA